MIYGRRGLSKGYEKEIEVKYFTEVMEAIELINSMEEKENILLLTCYKFKGQDINGISVIGVRRIQ
jgi:hypothetical protein